MKYNDEYKLCYVYDNRAWFTTQELNAQWGDDWNDAPYEHNAEIPYKYRDTVYNLKTRKMEPNPAPRYEVVCVYYGGEFTTPEDGHYNSPYSVEQINAGAVPWLKSIHAPIKIWAGATYPEFVALIHEAGGIVYEPLSAHN